MIQRIQTLYFAISIICLGIATSGITFFEFEDKGVHGFINAFGKTILTYDNKITATQTIPFFIGTLDLIVLCALAIFSFKKIKTQLKLGRLALVIYTLSIAGLLAFPYITEMIPNGVDTKITFGTGVYIFIAGLPFVFLANVGITKDKNLLDSLNRLR